LAPNDHGRYPQSADPGLHRSAPALGPSRFRKLGSSIAIQLGAAKTQAFAKARQLGGEWHPDFVPPEACAMEQLCRMM
jgi:hypothetical protein